MRTVRPYAEARPSSMTTATAAGSPRPERPAGSSTVEVYRGSEDFTRGATTGWLAAGGALESPWGSDGSAGRTATAPLVCTGCTGCAVATEYAPTVETGAGDGAEPLGGGTYVEVVGATVGCELADSTSMRPCPVRTPSVAVTVADLWAM